MALTDNLISYYKLDETSGTSAADIVTGFTGTITGTTLNQTGKIGKAILFNGSSDYIETTNTNVYSDITINLWIKTTAGTGTNFGVINKRASAYPLFDLMINTDLIGFNTATNVGNSKTLTCAGVDSDVFTMVTITLSGGVGTIYKNGQLMSSLSGMVGMSGVATLKFMRNQGYGYASGTLDDVSIWNRVLSTSEINFLYNSGNGIFFIQ
jgi:hypothetical protein